MRSEVVIGVRVIYLEQRPAPPLNRFVRSLWYARAPQPGHRLERVLPTGRTQVILNLARDYILDARDNGPLVKAAPSLVIGARSVYEVVDTSDMADLIGMVFEPGAFPLFAGDAADLFSNRSVDLEDIWGHHACSLRDRLREIPAPQARLQWLEADLRARLTERLMRKPVRLQGAIDFALSRFGEAPGVATVARGGPEDGLERAPFFAGLPRAGGPVAEGVVPGAAVSAGGAETACGRRRALDGACARLRFLRPGALCQRVSRLFGD